MSSKDVKTTPGGIRPANGEGTGEKQDNLHIETTSSGKDIIPDEVPRKDGPGGE